MEQGHWSELLHSSMATDFSCHANTHLLTGLYGIIVCAGILDIFSGNALTPMTQVSEFDRTRISFVTS